MENRVTICNVVNILIEIPNILEAFLNRGAKATILIQHFFKIL